MTTDHILAEHERLQEKCAALAGTPYHRREYLAYRRQLLSFQAANIDVLLAERQRRRNGDD